MRGLRVATWEEVLHYGKTLPRGLLAPMAGAAGFGLVGTIGTAIIGGNDAAVNPTFGTGENRTAGDLLVLYAAGLKTATQPATPSGWTAAVFKAGTQCSASIFLRIATGEDAAPTIAAIPSTEVACQLAEFSGNSTKIASIIDQIGTAAGTSSPLAATTGGDDYTPGELILTCAGLMYSAGGTKSTSDTLNNGAVATTTANTAGSQIYDFSYGVTTGNSAPDSDSFSFTTTNITGVALAIVSLKLAATPELMMMGAGSRACCCCSAALARQRRSPPTRSCRPQQQSARTQAPTLRSPGTQALPLSSRTQARTLRSCRIQVRTPPSRATRQATRSSLTPAPPASCRTRRAPRCGPSVTSGAGWPVALSASPTGSSQVRSSR